MATGKKTFGEPKSLWFCPQEECDIVMDVNEIKQADIENLIPWGSQTPSSLKLVPLCVNHGVALINCDEDAADAIMEANKGASDVVKSIMNSEESRNTFVPSVGEFLDLVSEHPNLLH